MDKNVEKTEFVKRLSEGMNKSGLKQVQIADRVGITDVSVCRYHDGTRIPRGDIIGRICKVIGITPNWLYGFEEPPKIRFCPYCGKSMRIEPKPNIDRGETVCVVGNKREIAALMDEGEFDEFCRIWREIQDDMKNPLHCNTM